MIRLWPRDRIARVFLASVLDSVASALLGAGAMAAVLGGNWWTVAGVALGWVVAALLRGTLAVAEAL